MSCLPTLRPTLPYLDEELWVKVLMYNPRDVGRAAELLRVSLCATVTAQRLGIECHTPCCFPGPKASTPSPAAQGGAVMGREWQPAESHLPYLLQLKVDFNLAGMGWLRIDAAAFRWGGGSAAPREADQGWVESLLDPVCPLCPLCAPRAPAGRRCLPRSRGSAAAGPRGTLWWRLSLGRRACSPGALQGRQRWAAQAPLAAA